MKDTDGAKRDCSDTETSGNTTEVSLRRSIGDGVTGGSKKLIGTNEALAEANLETEITAGELPSGS